MQYILIFATEKFTEFNKMSYSERTKVVVICLILELIYTGHTLFTSKLNAEVKFVWYQDYFI